MSLLNMIRDETFCFFSCSLCSEVQGRIRIQKVRKRARFAIAMGSEQIRQSPPHSTIDCTSWPLLCIDEIKNDPVLDFIISRSLAYQSKIILLAFHKTKMMFFNVTKQILRVWLAMAAIMLVFHAPAVFARGMDGNGLRTSFKASSPRLSFTLLQDASALHLMAALEQSP